MWVSVHQSLDGEKLEKLRKKLGCSKFEVVGILVLFWLWGKGLAETDGEIESCLAEIESVFKKHIVGCNKKPSEIVSALVETGWIDMNRGIPKIHDWDEWQMDDEQITLTGEKRQYKKTDYSPDFESFWVVYPRRVEKINAFRKYKARLNEGYSPDEMLRAAQNYACLCKKRGASEEYIKHPATFLGENKPFLDYLGSVNEEEDVLPFLKK